MSVSVVIRARNEAAHIGTLLRALDTQTISPDEIVVVDSGSDDGTPEIAAVHRRTRVLHIAPSTFTFGASLNRGIDAARGEYIVIASAHVRPVADDWIERLLAPLADPRVALAYGGQRGDERSRWSEVRLLEQWFPAQVPEVPASPFCNNANAAIRRADWERRHYDEQLTGLEDIAWAAEALAEGRKVAYVPDAAIVHVHDEDLRQVYRRFRREALALRASFPGSGLRARRALALAVAHVRADLADPRRPRGARAVADVVGYRFAQYTAAIASAVRPGALPTSLAARYWGDGVRPRTRPLAHREPPARRPMARTA